MRVRHKPGLQSGEETEKYAYLQIESNGVGFEAEESIIVTSLQDGLANIKNWGVLEMALFPKDSLGSLLADRFGWGLVSTANCGMVRAMLFLGCFAFGFGPFANGQEITRQDALQGFEEPGSDASETTPRADVTIPESERPSPRPDDLVEREHPATLEPSESELQEMSQWVRWFALKNLPPNFEDNRKWGKQKKVYDGVDVEMDGLRLDTKRRWKMVDHGTWTRYFIEFIDPANRLEIRVLSFDAKSNGRRFTTQLRIVAPLKIFARMSRFQRDVQIISVSIQSDATVALEIDLDVGIRVNPLVFPPDVQFQPVATRAEVQVIEFETHRISQIHGDLAEWLGQGIRALLDRKISAYNDKLVSKINDAFAKQKDRLTLSAQQWLSSKLNRKSDENGDTTSGK